jgi:hypothetical protein
MRSTVRARHDPYRVGHIWIEKLLAKSRKVHLATDQRVTGDGRLARLDKCLRNAQAALDADDYAVALADGNRVTIEQAVAGALELITTADPT